MVLTYPVSRNQEFSIQLLLYSHSTDLHNINDLPHVINITGSFLIVDCGGGTVDLTVRILKENNKLTEVTERTGDFCGGSYVDKEFLKYLEKQIGSSAMRTLEEKHLLNYNI